MRRVAALALTMLLVGTVAGPALAAPVRSTCHLAGFVRTSAGRCPRALGAGAGPHPQSLIGGIFGGVVSGAVKKVLSFFVSWADDGAADALRFTASLIGTSTEPALQSTWFSSAYWRVGALSALLTVPFLFAAAIHAIVRSDLALLGRAAFGYLPLAMIGVGVAAPLTALVLSATDEMCSFVAAAGGNADTAFLGHAASTISSLSIIGEAPFVALFAGMITVAATLGLWLELLIRAAAVDVIVLMLPLFFAAMVWPARRVWAIRAIETLIALILAKFAIIAVLTLGGAALDDADSGLSALLSGATLILLATVSPWALLRVLPLHEVAAAAAGGLSQGPRDAFSRGLGRLGAPDAGSDSADDDPAEVLTTLPMSTSPPDPGPGGGRGRPRGSGALPLQDDLGSPTASRAAVAPVGVDTPAPAPTPASAPAGADNRPPINAAFAEGERHPFVLGDGVTERMSAPRFVSGGDAAERSPAADHSPGPVPTPTAVRESADAAHPPALEEPPIDEPPRIEPSPLPPPRPAATTDWGFEP